MLQMPKTEHESMPFSFFEDLHLRQWHKSPEIIKAKQFTLYIRVKKKKKSETFYGNLGKLSHWQILFYQNFTGHRKKNICAFLHLWAHKEDES